MIHFANTSPTQSAFSRPLGQKTPRQHVAHQDQLSFREEASFGKFQGQIAKPAHKPGKSFNFLTILGTVLLALLSLLFSEGASSAKSDNLHQEDRGISAVGLLDDEIERQCQKLCPPDGTLVAPSQKIPTDIFSDSESLAGNESMVSENH